MKSQLKFRHLFLQGWGQRIKPYEIVDGVGKKSADQGIYNPGSAELLRDLRNGTKEKALGI